MGKRRSMMRAKKYYDAYIRPTIRPWSDVTDDVLSLVMMKLGAIDFLAFSGVCKSWRSAALSNRNMFMVSRPPMSLSISKYNEKKDCYLEDFEGRKFKTVLPHSAYKRCIGVTCGYLILLGSDCWLVNLITRHELHFPDAPSEVISCFGYFRGIKAILVFSPPISEWLLVVLHKCDHKIWFCIAGKREWTEVSHCFRIHDLIAFKGKIYTVYSVFRSLEMEICEMRFYPEPKLVLLGNKNFSKPHPGYPGFVTCGDKLYVISRLSGYGIDRLSKVPDKIHELDFGEMKWVSREKTIEKYAFFRDRDDYHCDEYSYTLREVWADIHSQVGEYAVDDEQRNGLLFHAKVWYFFDNCLNVDLKNE